MKISKRKEEQLAQHAAKRLQWQGKMKPYNTCEVKKYWDDLVREKWIETCQNLYGEVGREGKEVVSFSLWEKALLEFFFLAPYAWPDSREFPSHFSRNITPGLISDLQDFPEMERQRKELKETVGKLEVKYYTHRSLRERYNKYRYYSNGLNNWPFHMQHCIDTIDMVEQERSRMAQKEAEAVLEKFKFGQGFSLQSSCLRVIKDLVLKHVNGDTEMVLADAVDTLPLPELVMNMIDPIIPQRFDTASCPMYKLVTSFARGEWLNTPLRFENILDLKKSAL